MRILYVSYNGATEPLVQSQVLAYLEGLQRFGHWFKLLTFEKREAALANPAALGRVARQLRALHIQWLPLPYHKRPSLPATLLDALWGTAQAWWLGRSWPFDVAHARSYVPALVGLGLQRLSGVALLFDMRGLMADEFVEGGLWPRGGLKHGLAKWAERHLLAAADEIVVLTENIRDYLATLPYVRAPITVIPCCVDLQRFSPSPRVGSGGAQEAPCLIYAGSVGTWYLLSEMLRFYRVAREALPGLRFRLLTAAAEHERVRAAARYEGLEEGAIDVGEVPYEQVPGELAQASAGISFRKATFSQRASSPVKIGEYLAAGLPVVANAGVGDTERLLEGNGVGVVVRAFDGQALRSAAGRLAALLGDRETPARCRAIAERELSLELGVQRYQEVYTRLARRLRGAA